VPGDPIAARDALLGVIAGHTLNYRYRVNKRGEPQLDPYRRQVILMYVQGANVACPLLKAGLVVYAEKYDHKGTIKRECKLRQ
jgi:endonuclease YncB( thermonuclease family)